MLVIGNGSVPEEFHGVLDLGFPLPVGVGLSSGSPSMETALTRDQTKRNAISKGKRK